MKKLNRDLLVVKIIESLEIKENDGLVGSIVTLAFDYPGIPRDRLFEIIGRQKVTYHGYLLNGYRIFPIGLTSSYIANNTGMPVLPRQINILSTPS